MVPVALLQLAEEEFPFLMRHPQNREDALQVLVIAQWEAPGKDTKDVARAGLTELAQALGYCREGDVWRRAA